MCRISPCQPAHAPEYVYCVYMVFLELFFVVFCGFTSLEVVGPLWSPNLALCPVARERDRGGEAQLDAYFLASSLRSWSSWKLLAVRISSLMRGEMIPILCPQTSGAADQYVCAVAKYQNIWFIVYLFVLKISAAWNKSSVVMAYLPLSNLTANTGIFSGDI